ncbi:probable inactive leucine-rich repeat receptor-like protein kinase At3g03770 [Elaeis guineensis]|uniref:Probable inactive leucine-rich repeat receptor-like protein kinase At3g03770 n=1 Tax=Elaeis guineensis var. tenera TaxID=51953 RepID=A0A6I9RXY3_ELAGV|nr:probable inactive leucine-rich repeat receptor-like protein kinase At3g03770 [Elaeis guineensis]
MARALVFLVVIFSCLFLIRRTEQIQTSQTQQLLQLRKQLQYPKQLDAWNNTDDLCYAPSSPVVHVGCEGDLVTMLKIVGDKLAKPGEFEGYSIPDQTLSESFSVDSFVTTLTRLTTLKVVILVSLGIWGPLPDKIHRLNALEVLDLSSNFLYGSIPPKLSAMTRLQTLTLDGNFFNDTVPDWFDSFSNLTVLSLRGNRLHGPLPATIGRVTTLTELALSGNNISGAIPDLSGLTSLDLLDLRDNKLDSELPAMPKGLVTALLSKNSLTGEIPEQFGELSRLQHLDLSCNLLEGTPPAELFSLPNISYLNLASNMFTGSISSSITCSSQLGYVDISTNRLTGGLPSCLNSNSNKRAVKFNGNCLSIDPQHQRKDKYCQKSQIKGKDAKTRDIGLMVAVIGGITLVVLVLLLVFLVVCRRNCRRAIAEQRLLPKPVQENSATGFSSELLANARYISQAMKLGMQVLPTYRVFSLEELKEATKNFEHSAYVGEGSIGKLYKGRLENGTFVAIRCLALFKQYSIRNLKLRLDLLSKLRHPHLVCLLGHCVDGVTDDSSVNRIFLIYDYVPNGNLRTHLSECSLERALKWSDRMAILIGIAKAVHFLHTGIIPGCFNNRLKTDNILLDEHLIAKVSDYGLSIISEEIYKQEASVEGQKSMHNESLALEMLNVDDDVYSFGLILLEALVGPALSKKGIAYFLKELAMSFSKNEEQKHILDPIILGTSSQESLSIVISLTNKCLSPESSTRPSMEDVLWNLQYAAQVQATADGDQRSDVASQA